MSPKLVRIPFLCLALFATLAWAQDALTLDEALRLAKLRNGTIRAAAFDARAAKARVNQALAAYFPTVTPFLEYNNTRGVTDTSTGSSVFHSDGTTTGVDASWKILDAGQREFSVQGAKRSAAASQFDAVQTLRETLYLVHQEYYDALRSQELLRVAQSQVDRTQKIYDQAEFGSRPDIGTVAKKDVLQARADLLNAKTELLRVKNLTSTSLSDLKATIGWDQTKDLPPLQKEESPVVVPQAEAVEDVVKNGLANRADLQARRKRVDAQRFDVLRADRDASFGFDLNLKYSRNFSPNQNDNRNLQLLVTYPLFDGGLLRERARESRLSWEGSKALLTQAERQAQAEIEAAYSTYIQNGERVTAAKLALDAADENYKAAKAAQDLGANDIIAVLTAQVSLVTAESNYIEATYDFYVSDVNLRLVTGRPIPGEDSK
jgi:outer membrane protein